VVKIIDVYLLQGGKAVYMMKQVAVVKYESVKADCKRYPNRAHNAGLFHAYLAVCFVKQAQIKREHYYNEDNKAGDEN
jgi:hypothetical protein